MEKENRNYVIKELCMFLLTLLIQDTQPQTDGISVIPLVFCNTNGIMVVASKDYPLLISDIFTTHTPCVHALTHHARTDMHAILGQGQKRIMKDWSYNWDHKRSPRPNNFVYIINKLRWCPKVLPTVPPHSVYTRSMFMLWQKVFPNQPFSHSACEHTNRRWTFASRKNPHHSPAGSLLLGSSTCRTETFKSLSHLLCDAFVNSIKN